MSPKNQTHTYLVGKGLSLPKDILYHTTSNHFVIWFVNSCISIKLFKFSIFFVVISGRNIICIISRKKQWPSMLMLKSIAIGFVCIHVLCKCLRNFYWSRFKWLWHRLQNLTTDVTTTFINLSISKRENILPSPLIMHKNFILVGSYPQAMHSNNFHAWV